MPSRLQGGDKFRGLAVVEALPVFEWWCPRCGEQYIRAQEYFDWNNDDGDHVVVDCINCDKKFLVVIKDEG